MSYTRHWGSTPEERSAPFPCDLIIDGDDALFRAITIAAPPGIVYRWLCQLRVAPYSYDLLDNLGKASPRELTPGLDQLEVGQRVMTIFKLVAFEPGESITLVLDRGSRVFGDIAVTYRATAAGDGTRLVVKYAVRRSRGVSRWFASLLPAGDLVMMRKQLLTLKRLAEQTVAISA